MNAPIPQLRQTLADIFAADEHPYEEAHQFFEEKITELSEPPTLITKMRGTNGLIDLEGRVFILDRPLNLRGLQLITICNGTLVAGPGFPLGEYLIRLSNAHGIQFRNLFLECSKRANGVHLEDFFRIRIEDCYLVHQKEYGIYSSPSGNNHELEIFKCHISEFLFGDGYPKKSANFGVIPEFDVDANRVSTGIFLGQADNVVADCNINLCRIGIFSGMRANRIQGNHITGGGSQDLEIFKGIELNNFHKSSAIIVNNYIDNCCLWINCTADAKRNLRNYFHVTDNLFYRGYNHPKAGGEFSHIIINPLEPNSLVANLHICDNMFYNQPENLDGIKPRVIKPVRIGDDSLLPGMREFHRNWDPYLENGDLLEFAGLLKKPSSPERSLDHAALIGVTMKNNHFTNCFPTYVVPMGSKVTKIIDLIPGKEIYRFNFEDEIPLGLIQHAHVEILGYTGDAPPTATIKKVKERIVVISVAGESKGKLAVTASTEGSYGGRYDYYVQ